MARNTHIIVRVVTIEYFHFWCAATNEPLGKIPHSINHKMAATKNKKWIFICETQNASTFIHIEQIEGGARASARNKKTIQHFLLLHLLLLLHCLFAGTQSITRIRVQRFYEMELFAHFSMKILISTKMKWRIERNRIWFLTQRKRKSNRTFDANNDSHSHQR